jgi:hypothetical protein
MDECEGDGVGILWGLLISVSIWLAILSAFTLATD